MSWRLSHPASWFRWHRWLGYLVGIQVFLWLAGGLVFAWLPFQDQVKSGAMVRPPALTLDASAWQSLRERGLAFMPQGLTGLQLMPSAQGTVIKWKDSAGQGCRRLDGGACQPVDEAQAVAFARTLYQGPASTPATAMKLQAGAPSQWGIVREFRSSSPAWQVRFQDDLQQRVYVSVATGEYLGARNDRWVLYDFFWRLHVMDYSEGEDFNHPLIRVASALALLLSLTGLVMLAMAVRRRWRRRLAA